MFRTLIATCLAGTMVGATPLRADDLQLHTFLLTWADEHCEGFSYPADLLRHAHIAVFDAPEEQVAEFRRKADAGLHQMFDGDQVEYCAFVVDSIEAMQTDAD